MLFETTLAITIGKTNSYVSVNGTTVANADGVRATPSMANEGSDVGLAARSKWVRFPESTFARTDKKFWQALLADLKITASENCGGELKECFTTFILEEDDDLKMVENEIKNSFNKNHFVLTRPERLLIQTLKPETATTASVIDFGGTKTKLTRVIYSPTTKLFQTTSSQTFDFGGQDLIKKITDLAETDFKRKNRQVMGGESLNARSKRKLYLAAMQTMQTLSNSNQGNLHVDSIFEGIDLNMNVSRGRFNDLIKPVFDNLFKNFGDSKDDVIFLTGGCSRIPALIECCKKFADKVETLDFEETFGNLASKSELSFGNLAGTKKGAKVDNREKEHLKCGSFGCTTSPVSICVNETVLLAANSPLPIAKNGTLSVQEKFTIRAGDLGPLTEPFTIEKLQAELPLEYLVAYDEDGNCHVEFYQKDEVLKAFAFSC